MEQTEKIEIYSSKKKSALVLIGSIFFVALGILFLTGVFGDKGIERIVGGASIVFFGFGIYVGIRQLIKNKLMFVIDQQGINVNPEKTDERIPWKDINGFPVLSINGAKIILVSVNNPQYWIDKEISMIRKKLMIFNYNNYQAPFNFSANSMKITHKQLLQLLNTSLSKHKINYSN